MKCKVISHSKIEVAKNVRKLNLSQDFSCDRDHQSFASPIPEIVDNDKTDLEKFFEELELRDESGCAKLLVCRVAAKTSAYPERALAEAEKEVS